jgi:hypothetical protein
MVGDKGLSIKAFLSHRYRSPEINLYFFKLFSESAEIHFEVDLGTVATNVTRLERMIRSCDAFIGIYPYPGDQTVEPTRRDILKASQYFRLELDLAIRSRKPALILYDKRYGGIFRWSRNVRFLDFNPFEIMGSGNPPNEGRYRKVIEQFIDAISKLRAYRLSLAFEEPQPTDIGLLLPTEGDDAYGGSDVDLVKDTLDEHGHQDLRVLKYPPILNKECFAILEELDWVIADIGDHKASALVGYMHSQFVPTMRLLRTSNASQRPSQLEGVLYGGVEVGYGKDIIRWSDAQGLKQDLKNRLESLRQGVRYIGDVQEAHEYFLEASRRKKSVFLSYAKDDIDAAGELTEHLRRYFQEVFDYRDGRSLIPGGDWMGQISQQLTRSDLSIALISSSYLNSEYCKKELRLMLNAQMEGELRFFPIKLHRESLELPEYMNDVHYLRRWEHNSMEAVAKFITKTFDEEAKAAVDKVIITGS